MVHRQYEEWLLNDERLTPEQERDLQIHLRGCASCAMLARTNTALRAAPVTAPSPGFVLRFQARLEAERKIQRRRTVSGLAFLTIATAVFLAWALLPYIHYFLLSPIQFLTLWLSNILYIALTLRTVSILSSTLFSVFMAFIPGYVWPGSLAILAGLGLMFNLSFRKITHLQAQPHRL